MAGGLAGLVVGPLVAVLMAHGAQQAQVAVAPTTPPQQVVQAGSTHPLNLVPREDRAEVRASLTPVAPPAPATPAPTAAPTLRPAAVVAPVVAAPPTGTIESIIKAAADAHGVSYSWMLKIAKCESNLNPRAVNPRGPYIGLFQFAPSTFRAHGGTDIYDPVQQATITADMLAHGQARAWACA